MITLAVPKGRIFQETISLMKEGGFPIVNEPDLSRKLIITTKDPNLRLLIVRGQDVLTYVKYGSADLGIIGSDILTEFGEYGIYQPLDLGIGICRLSVAVSDLNIYNDLINSSVRFRVASKYPNQALDYFSNKGIHVDIIKLYGSMELAPLVGLADAIVDLVSTGKTLEENGLHEIELIKKISSRLIVNKASFKLKNKLISNIIRKFSTVINTNA
jgi:ATP phosphoribosyltransferase